MRMLPVKVLILLNLALVLAGPAVQAQTVDIGDTWDPAQLAELHFFFQHLANLDAAADAAEAADGTFDASSWRTADQRAAGLTDFEGTAVKETASGCLQSLRDHDIEVQAAAGTGAEVLPDRTQIVASALDELRLQLGEETLQRLASYVHTEFGSDLEVVSSPPGPLPPGAAATVEDPSANAVPALFVAVGGHVTKLSGPSVLAECFTNLNDDTVRQNYPSGITGCDLLSNGLPPERVSCNGTGQCFEVLGALPGLTRWTEGIHALVLSPGQCTPPDAPPFQGLLDPLHFCPSPGTPIPFYQPNGTVYNQTDGPACWPFNSSGNCIIAQTRSNFVTFIDIFPFGITLGQNEHQTFNTNIPAVLGFAGPGSLQGNVYYAPSTLNSPQIASIRACDFVQPQDDCVPATIHLQPQKVEVTPANEEVLPGGTLGFSAQLTPSIPEQTVTWTWSLSTRPGDPAGTFTVDTADSSKGTYKAPTDNPVVTIEDVIVKACAKSQRSSQPVCGTAKVFVKPILFYILGSKNVLTLEETTQVTAFVQNANVPLEITWKAPADGLLEPLTPSDVDPFARIYYAPPYPVEAGGVDIEACLEASPDFCAKYHIKLPVPLSLQAITSDTGKWQAGTITSFTITGTGWGPPTPVAALLPLETTVTSFSETTIRGKAVLSVGSQTIEPTVAVTYPNGTEYIASLPIVSLEAAPISVAPPTTQLTAGGTQQFGVFCQTSTGDPCTSQEIPSWRASLGTFSAQAGLSVTYTAPASVSSNTTDTIRACWPSGACAIAQVTLVPPPVVVTVSPKTATVSAGLTQQLTAQVTGTTNTAVTWSIEPSAPEAGSITQSGLYTAPATLGSVTTVTVTATSQADATRKDIATVTLMAPCASQSKPFEVLAGRCTVVGADRDIIVTPGFSFDVRTALQPMDGSAVDSRCFRFEWTSSLDPTPVGGQSFTVPGVPMTLTLKVTSLDNAYSDSITLTVKTDPNAYNSCVKRRPVRSSGGSSSSGSSSSASSAYATLIQLGESVTLSPPEGINGTSFDWYKADPNNLDILFSHDATVVVSPTVDTRYWLVYRYTDSNGVFHEEQSEIHYVLINRPAPPRVHIEPRFQVIPASTGPVMEVIDDAVTDGNYEGYTFEWNVGSDNTRPSTPLPWPYRRLVLDRVYDSSFWCKVTDRNGNVMVTEVATVAVTCSDGLRGSIGVSPGNYLSKTDRPVVSAYAQGLRLSYDWFERLPEETTPRPYSAFGAAISPTVAQPLTYYSAKIQDACGQTAVLPETPVYLCVPTIDSQPVDQVVQRGGSTSLAVAASPALAGQPLTIAWRSGETGQVVGSGPTLNLTPAPGTTQTFYAEVSADCSGTLRSVQTRAATVTGCELAATAYSDRNIAPGQTATLTTAFSGTLVPPSEVEYTWYYGPAPGTEYVSGVGLWSITPTPQTTTTYWVRVNDGTCTAQSNPVTVRICVPVITSQPQGTTMRAGQTANLSIGVMPLNNETLQYQWYAGASGDVTHPVSGATSSTLATPALTATTSYWVRVTSSCGATVNSATAVVTVCNNPAISSVTPTRYVRYPETTWHQVYVTGSNLTYQWYTGSPGNTSAPIAGATQSSISKAPATTTTYWARVTSSSLCTTDSPAMVIDVCTDPPITTQPAAATINGGQSATLTVATSATGATYQWYLGTGAAIQGATSSSLTVTPTADTQYYAQVTRGTCTSTSETATVTVCALAVSLAGGTNIASGQNATLTASVSNTRGTYASVEWYAGTGTNSLLIASGSGLGQKTVSPTNTTQYWVRVSDGTCTVDSTPVTVRVCVPVINAQPQGTVIRSGQTASLSVGVTPMTNETLQYQWYAGASGDVTHPVSGATSSTFTTPALTATTSYWVRVTSSCGATTDSAAAVVTVCNNPAISSVTPTRYIRYGESTWHQVYATGNSLTYQWYTGSPGNTSAPIAGATLSSISKSPATTTTYWARVTSYGLCTTDSPAMVIDVCTDPPITTQPASTTINSGQPATLTVATSATGAIYQWYLGTGSAIQGATSASLTVTPTADTQYYAQVTRGACTVTSSTATVTACALSVSLSGGTNTASGQSATLSASASNTRGTYANYEWYAGTGANSLLIASGSGLGQKTVSPTSTTQYWVRISDGICTADSSPVTVSVCKPTITAQPQGKTVSSGQTATLSVTATGAPLSYQWYIGAAGNTAQPIAGATSASYTTPAMSATTSYWARVTGCTTADSASATVTVCAPPAITSGPTADTQRYPNTWGWMLMTPSGTNLTYQWFTGQSGDTSQPVPGCTSANCNFLLTTSKYYWVRIIGACGTLNSPAVIHPVSPTITQQPQSASVPPNATPTLSLTATGTDLTYQWYRGSTGNTATPMSGATAATFTVPPVTTAPVSYWCKVTSAGNSTAFDYSAEATLSFCTGPSIYGPYAQYLGYNQWQLAVGSYVDEDIGNFYCAWYTGVPGNVAQSVFQYEGGNYTYVTATGTQTWWCRAWYSDHSCYTDTGGATIYKVQ